MKFNIDKYCKVDFVNQTRDEAIALDDTHWVTSVLKPTKLHISCLTTTSYIQLKVQVIELKPGCEEFTSNMLITPMNNLQIMMKNPESKKNTKLAAINKLKVLFCERFYVNARFNSS